jgi:hypothetical protein
MALQKPRPDRECRVLISERGINHPSSIHMVTVTQNPGTEDETAKMAIFVNDGTKQVIFSLNFLFSWSKKEWLKNTPTRRSH